MKKLAAMVLILSLSLFSIGSFIGCGGGDTPSTDDSAPAGADDAAPADDATPADDSATPADDSTAPADDSSTEG